MAFILQIIFSHFHLAPFINNFPIFFCSVCLLYSMIFPSTLKIINNNDNKGIVLKHPQRLRIISILTLKLLDIIFAVYYRWMFEREGLEAKIYYLWVMICSWSIITSINLQIIFTIAKFIGEKKESKRQFIKNMSLRVVLCWEV